MNSFPLNQTLTARLVDELRTHRMLNAIEAMRSLKHVARKHAPNSPSDAPDHVVGGRKRGLISPYAEAS